MVSEAPGTYVACGNEGSESFELNSERLGRRGASASENQRLLVPRVDWRLKPGGSSSSLRPSET